MDFPKFPYIEVAKNNAKIVENSLVENFLKNFISQLVNEQISTLMSTKFIMHIHRSMKFHSWKHLAIN